MWAYEKKLQFPVNIKNPNPSMAKVIITQFGGPDGELAASQRYLAQRYTAPYGEVKGILTDIGMSCLKCAHTNRPVSMRNSAPHSICVEADLNKHQSAFCHKR